LERLKQKGKYINKKVNRIGKMQLMRGEEDARVNEVSKKQVSKISKALFKGGLTLSQCPN